MKLFLNLNLHRTIAAPVALALMLSCVARAAFADEPPVIAYPVDQLGPGHGPFVGRYSSKEDVCLILGDPYMQLSPNVWIYRNRQTTDVQINRLGYDTMVIVFAKNLVVEQRLVSFRDVDALRSRLQRRGH